MKGLFSKATLRWLGLQVKRQGERKIVALFLKYRPQWFWVTPETLRQHSKNIHAFEESIFEFDGNTENYPATEILIFSDNVSIVNNQIPIVKSKIALPLLTPPNYSGKITQLSLLDIHRYRNPANASTVEGNVMPLTNKWSYNYHHWLCECLPALVAVMEKFPAVLIAVPESLSQFQRKTLQLLGFDDTKLVSAKTIHPESLILVNNIRIKNRAWPTSVISPAAIKKMRKLILEKITITNAVEKIDVLWISRSAENNRHVINELAYVQSQSFNVKVMYPTRESLEEQISQASRAHIIIGPHGAGLTNILWSDQATLIEIGPSRIVNNSFRSLAASIGCKYHYLPASVVGTHYLKNRRNLLVDIDALSVLVESIRNSEKI